MQSPSTNPPTNQRAPFAIALAIGPSEKELARTADLIDSLRAYETGPAWFVMTDDAPEPRSLEKQFNWPAGYTPISVHHKRPPVKRNFIRSKGICSAVLTGFAWISKNAPEVAFALKLDTDALIIAPFYNQIAGMLHDAPEAGMMGAYDKSPNGEPRGIEYHQATMSKLHRPPVPLRKPRIALRALRRRLGIGRDPLTRASKHIGIAVSRGYQYGEHCLGGAYAVSGELLRRMNAGGFMEDPQMWLSIDCPEDVMMGMYTRAAGMKFLGAVDPGQAFGVRYKGLAFAPEQLLARGYSVIHSVKNDPNMTEEQIREFFKSARTKSS